MSQAGFIPIKHKFTLPASQRDELEARLMSWREDHKNKCSQGAPTFLSSRVDLPDKHIKKLLDHGGDFLRIPEITPTYIRKVISWDMASLSDLKEVAAIILSWRQFAANEITPASQAGRRKKSQKTWLTDDDPTPQPSPIHSTRPLPQPVFITAPMASSQALNSYVWPATSQTVIPPLTRPSFPHASLSCTSTFPQPPHPRPLSTHPQLLPDVFSQAKTSATHITVDQVVPPTQPPPPPQSNPYYRNHTYSAPSAHYRAQGVPTISNVPMANLPSGSGQAHYRAQTLLYRGRK